jgi:hypothetical protein
MPGNSDKSSEKPKPVQTVQTLLAAKNGSIAFFCLFDFSLIFSFISFLKLSSNLVTIEVTTVSKSLFFTMSD